RPVMPHTPLPRVRLGRASRFLVVALGSFLAMLPAGRGVRADDDSEPTDAERIAEDIERHTERGLRAFARGNYDEVLARMKRLADVAPDDPFAPTLVVRTLART